MPAAPLRPRAPRKRVIKLIAFARAADEAAAAHFADGLIGEVGPALLREHAAAGLIVNRVIPTPADVPYRPPSDPAFSPSGKVLRCDAIVELWAADGAWTALYRGLLDRLRPVAGEVHAYRVAETEIMRRGCPAPAMPTPGVKLVGRLMFHADMPDSAVRRSWALHAGLAVRVHIGACRYAQNWVEAALSPDCPPARGMPELHFPSPADLSERFFDSPRGRDEILQDTAHFVADGPRFYTDEFVLRAPPGRTAVPA